MTDLLISGGTPVTGYDDPAPGDLLVRDGHLAEGAPGPGARTLDASGLLVLPGLVNTHDHLRSLLPMTRRGDTSGLAEMIRAGQLAGAAATPEDFRALTALAAARMVLSGVTTAVDHVYPLHSPGMLAAVAAGHAEVGLRAHLAYGLTEEYDEQIELAVAAAGDEVPADRLYLAPVSLRQTSADGYRAAARAAERTGLRLYTHIAETRDEVDKCQAEHGLRPVELLYEAGFLRPGTVLVHCVHLNEREIGLLADNEVAVAYCPSNHLRLAKGFAPVVALREAGVRVGLGIDGMDDLFTEMRQAVYAQGQAAGRPGVLGSDAALRMATGEGAAAVGERQSGRLRAGDPADLITLRPGASMRPLADPVQSCVHRAHGQHVADVLVDGEFVVRDGRLVRADERELADRAWRITRDLARRTGREHAADWQWGPGAPQEMP
ncbi:amidohydrolase family protein [Spongiactinospora sp. TRM90649]|uniref:amidohydrolase family protein n=1 Tax=Spongiactinospora sp. TRM90649 TaxID=3031114 RepID=UPI0023F7F559|nr:amidohydrolase family protein [Spongiactinospora sp. TRM90649]MDF5758321.1 amidohydrolase family protein [Spongiactinospora sp. TRM90649]